MSGGGPAGQLLLMIVRTRFRRRFFSLLPFLSSFDRSPFGSSLFPSPLLRLVGAGASGRAASVGILLFSHTVCWTVCDYRTRTLSFCFLFCIFFSALVCAGSQCFMSEVSSAENFGGKSEVPSVLLVSLLPLHPLP